MSTSVGYASLEPSWKQEVNLRLAAHKSRKGPALAEPDARCETRHSASRRAAEAAARVAARYANAPSYSEVLAGEARAALRAAEAASRAALHAQAAAASVLAGIEAAAPAAEPQSFAATAPLPPFQSLPEPEPAFLPEPEPPAPARPLSVRWSPDLPARSAEPSAVTATHGSAQFASEWNRSVAQSADIPEAEAIEVVEPAQPIHANLIEFPRELVATRKVRPRRAEGASAEAEPGTQLSIFEVDPDTIVTEPAPLDAVEPAAEPAWSAPEWSGIELAAEPEQQLFLEEEHPLSSAPELAVDCAPMNLRLMAFVVDCTLVLASLLGAGLLIARNAAALPALRTVEVGSVLAFLAALVAYHVFFFTMARATPGMMYAHIRLCTIDGQIPSRAQRSRRLAALLLSLLPLGLGIVWAIFDDLHLTWHDRLSGTYLRRY